MKPSLLDVLAAVVPGRVVRLHLNPAQKQAFRDRDGRLALRVVRALLRARRESTAPRAPRDTFPLTEGAFQAVARKLGHTVGIKRSRALIRRLIAAGIILPSGSYRQPYRVTGASGHRVKLYKVGVRITGLRTGLRSALCLQPAVGKRGVVKRPKRVPWWQHPLFGTPDGLPPPVRPLAEGRRQQVTVEQMRSRDEQRTRRVLWGFMWEVA